MKIWITLSATCLIFFGSTQVHGKNDVEGKWINATKGLTLIVETTSNGIRVKRTDQQNWYEYEEYRVGQYRDKDGNNYYLIDGEKLEWEGKDGERRLVFSRGSIPTSSIPLENDAKDQSEYHVERNYYYGDAFGPSQLEGWWRNRSSGQSIFVQAHKHLIKVRAHRGGWTTFYRDDRNTYFDNRGNRYDISAGKMFYSSRSGDFKMVFIPS